MALAFFALIFLAGCGALPPADTPPQLAHTPGAPIVVSESRIDAGIFQLAYPPDWRVVKLNEAGGGGLHLMFVAPDGGSVRLRQVDADTPGERVLILENGWGVEYAIAPGDQPSPHFDRRARALVASIQPRRPKLNNSS